MTSTRRTVADLALIALGLAFAGGAAADDPRFDVSVVDTPARAFFEGLIDGTNYNVVLEEGVSGSINLKLRNVTVTEALNAARDAYGYDYRKVPGGFVIEPSTIQTRLFQVNYLALERRGSSRTTITSGQVSEHKRSDGVTQQAAMSGEGSADGGNDRPERGGLTGSAVTTRSVSDFWATIEASLRALVGTEAGRRVVINAQSGVVAVRATPRELRKVQDYLDRIQNDVTRQVVLEAKILEVELNDGFQAGINWAIVSQHGTSTIGGFQRGPQQGFNSDLLAQPSVPITLGPGNPLTSLPVNGLGGPFALALDTANFSAFIELLQTQGKTRVLSSPRVSTINNQKAVIKAGNDEFFVTKVSSNTIVGTSSASNRDVELTPFFSGIALDVTPQIAEDGNVILHIHPTVSEVTEKTKIVKVAGQTDELPLAFSQVRESDSVVRAKSGQLIVIGGLMRTTRRVQDYQTPLLGDIPLLGYLFKSRRQVEQKSELVILLRPVVVDRDEQWAELVQGPVDHAASIDPKSVSGVR
jgi:MSHA biogenesis protein MshL